MEMVKLSDSRSERIIRQEKHKKNNFGKNLKQFLTFWEENKLNKDEIKDEELQKYIAETLFDCLAPQHSKETSIASQVALLAEKMAALLAELVKFVLKYLFARDKDVTCQAIVSADIDPRTLPDDVRQELGRAADNPSSWGIKENAWEAWGERHKVGRVRTGYVGEGIVYDAF